MISSSPRAGTLIPLRQLLAAVLTLSTILEVAVGPAPVQAASNLVVYSDGLAGGWENWSWDTAVSFGATAPTHGGSRSIAFTFNRAWAGLYLHTGGISTSGFTAVQFYLNGGSASGQLTDVALYDANLKQIPSPKPVNQYIQGGSIAAGQWRLVRIPLADLGGANRVISGILVQDLAGRAQPTIYLDDLQLVGSDPPTAGGSVAPAPPPVSTPAPQPASVAIGGPQPFTDVPNHPNEYLEAKGALQWMPQIKRAVGEAVAVGLLRPDERQLFENILLGMVGLESVGRNFAVGNASSQWYSQGLTQLVFANTYKEEDPFDPLTNLRDALRVVIRYYRRWGNRWDRAVAQHLTGAEDETAQRYTRDWNGTDGEDYAKRIVNIVWTASQLQAKGDLYPNHDNAYQASCPSCWYTRAPWWSIWDSPNLPYNWMPPSNNTAYWYVQSGVDGNIKQPTATNTWIPVPTWFYTTSPAPSVSAFNPRAPSAAEVQAYPAGRTPNVPWGETYPRRTWSVASP